MRGEDNAPKSNTQEVIRYYNKTESRVGYNLVLGGTKHFGYYSHGDNPWAFKAAMRRMEEKLASALDLPAGSTVLDAGCGVGDVAINLASNHGLRIVGIDILNFNIAEAYKRRQDQGIKELVEFAVMSYADLGFAGQHFDGVYTMETMVHAQDAERVLSEFWRVLKPGGRLVLFEYSRSPDSAMSARAARVIRQINEVAAMPSFQRFEHGVPERLVADAGFTDVKTEDITKHMIPMVRSFAIMTAIPYAIGVVTKRQSKVINSMSAVEFMRYRRNWRYNVITAIKPG
jgi:sterol 24-C-methyltransferase